MNSHTATANVRTYNDVVHTAAPGTSRGFTYDALPVCKTPKQLETMHLGSLEVTTDEVTCARCIKLAATR